VLSADFANGLMLGVVLGTAFGLLLALVVLPGVVDVWYGLVRIVQSRRLRRWHG
jgi:hypothetical protein